MFKLVTGLSSNVIKCVRAFKIDINITNVVQIQKKKNLPGCSHFVESVITALGLLSDFRKMKTKRGRASEKCRKKAGTHHWICNFASRFDFAPY